MSDYKTLKRYRESEIQSENQYNKNKRNKSDKTNRLLNQVDNGIKCGNYLTNTVTCDTCVGSWKCKSSTTNEFWTVYLKYNEKNKSSYFECGCGGKETVHCKHIVAILLKLITDQANLAGEIEQCNDNLFDAVALLSNMKL